MPDAATERRLNDQLWDRVRPLRPPRPGHPKGGRPVADDRACLGGIVHVLRDGLRWRQVPSGYPSGVTCRRRHRDGTAAGVWHRVWELVLRELGAAGKLDTSERAVDGTYIEARHGGRPSARAARGAGPRSPSSPTGRASHSGRRPTGRTSARWAGPRRRWPTSR